MKLKRWTVAAVGTESGAITGLTFLKFWTKEAAQAWIDKYTDKRRESLGYLDKLVTLEPRRITAKTFFWERRKDLGNEKGEFTGDFRVPRNID